MKMEIDLNEILGNEYGTETIEDSIQRQVTEYLVADFKTKVGQKMDQEISRKVDNLIDAQLKQRIPEMIDEIWGMDYTPVSRYGEKDKNKTTFKNELIRTISEQLIYQNPHYSSDQNVFTRAVNTSIDKAMSGFKKEFDAAVTKQFQKKAYAYALKQLSIGD